MLGVMGDNSVFNMYGVIENAMNKAAGRVVGTYAQGQDNSFSQDTTFEELGLTGSVLHNFHQYLQAAMKIYIPWSNFETWTGIVDPFEWIMLLINGAVLNNPANMEPNGPPQNQGVA